MPLGIFLNDSIGNAYENTPGVASGRGPYVAGVGSTVGNSLYETKEQLGSPGTAITYAAGNVLYVSVNGLITNLVTDAYEYQTAARFAGLAVGPTIAGIVKVAPDANSSLLVYDTRI